ncbi:MAG: hypothetical protein AAB547_01860 [Patescibacteria group bacterium]
MWYLIVPPIIVIASLSFVLWYFSRKGADPLIAEKAFRLGEKAQQQISFARTKAFLLRVLEKSASRFKVRSLRMHNALHDFTQTLKARQRRFQDKVSPSTAPSRVLGQKPNISRTGFLRRLTNKTKENEETSQTERRSASASHAAGYVPEKGDDMIAVAEHVAVSTTILMTPAAPKTISDNPETFTRQMVSETMAHPEKPRARTEGDTRREEALIARIAVNPKDFAAYEGLGDHYLDIGNIQDAKECYRQVLRFSPAHRMVKIKIRRLEKLFSEQRPM